MSEQLHPDIYVKEAEQSVFPIEATGTTGTCYLGFFKRGPINVATLVTNSAMFERIFGGAFADSFGNYVVNGDFFNRGKGRIYIIRLAHYTDVTDVTTLTAVTATLTIDALIKFDALDEGAWGNDFNIAITAGSPVLTHYNVVITKTSSASYSVTYPNVSNDPDDPRYILKMINGKDYNISCTHLVPATKTVCTPAVAAPLATGAYVVADIVAADVVGSDVSKIGMYAMSGKIDAYLIQLIACAESGNFIEASHVTIEQGMIDYALNKFPKVFQVGCLPVAFDTVLTDVDVYINTTLAKTSKESAIFYPWLKVLDSIAADPSDPYIVVPPVGHVLGCFARTDTVEGVWIAPAGTENGQMRGVVEPNVYVDDDMNDILSPLRVNSIRYQGGTLCIWGSKTLSTDPRWIEIPGRRFFNMIETGLVQQKFLVFKPIRPDTFASIQDSVKVYYKGFWKQGAMGGDGIDPKKSYYAKCDTDNNTIVEETARKIVCESGVRQLHFAEIIEFTVSQYDGGEYEVIEL